MNCWTFTGRLVEDPELRFTPTGKSVVKARVAVHEPGRESSTFVDLIAWGATSEYIAQWGRKGRLFETRTRLTQRDWEAKDGTHRTKLEAVVDGGYAFSFLDKSPDHGEPEVPAGLEVETEEVVAGEAF